MGATATPEQRAWFVANEARYGLIDEALAGADSIPPRSPWRVFARVVALCATPDLRSALPLARSLIATRPIQPDFVWAYAYALLVNGHPAAAVAALDSAPLWGVPKTAEFRALQGSALASMALGPMADSTARPRAVAAFADAQGRDSMNVDAYYFEGAHLASGAADTAAVARLGRAAVLSPLAPTIHTEYWDALLRLRDRPDDTARAAIARDVATILRLRGDYAGALYLAAQGYKTLDSLPCQYQLQDQILREHPASPEADQVLLDRIRALSDSISQHEVADSAGAARAYRTRLTELIARPVHHERSTLGAAYFLLFASESHDSTVTGDSLLRTVDGMVRYDAFNPRWTRVVAPVALADRRVALPYAERLAREGDSLLRRQFADVFALMNPRERAQQLAFALGEQRDALGWVYFNEGRVAEAERALTRARALAPANPINYYHLGRLAEALGRLDSAQARYANGYQLELTRTSVGANGVALRRLYLGHHGSSDGFDAYVDTLRSQGRRRREAAIAASRAAHPMPLPPFTLHLLGGRSPVASDSLRGKIVVLHFWGMWCGACVAELPDFERWYESARGDTAVVVITVDYQDADRRAVERFAEQRHLLFPILLDDDYVDKAGVHAFPTTWFIDRGGRVAFTREGWSGALAEEFDWRVEMLRH